MATVIIDLIENYTSYGFSPTGKLWKSGEATGGAGVEFEVPGYGPRYTRYVLNFWDANCVGRDEFQGPVSQGASATLSAQAAVISATPFAKPKLVAVQPGDLIVDPKLDLVLKVLAVAPGVNYPKYPGVEIVSCQPATADYSEIVAAENAKPKQYVSESYLCS